MVSDRIDVLGDDAAGVADDVRVADVQARACRTAACGSPCRRRRPPARAGRTGLLPGNRCAHSSFASSIRSISATRTSCPVVPSTLTARPQWPPERSVRMGPCAPSRNTRQSSPRCCRRCPRRTSPLADAHGRVLARDVAAAVALPGFDNSAMDGYAARWAEVATAARVPGPAARGRRHPGRPHRRRPPGAGHRAADHDRRPAAGRRRRRRPGRAHRRRHRRRRDPRRPARRQPPAARPARTSPPGAVALHRRHRRSAPPSSAWPPPSASPTLPGAPPSAGAGALHRQRARRARAAAAARADLRVQLAAAGRRGRGGRRRWPAGCTSSPTTSTSSSPPCAAELAGADLLITSGGVSAGAYEVVKDAFREPGHGRVRQGRDAAGRPAGRRHGRRRPGGHAARQPGQLVRLLRGVRPARAAPRPRPRLPRPAARARPADRRRCAPPPGGASSCAAATTAATVSQVGGPGSHLVAHLARANCLVVVPEDVTELPAGAEVDVVLIEGALQ